ncbi:MAG: glutamate racemase [Defluviitaleaceae bacterium]|nr:glutamate racemase [Defluviitaleaceae bacterium]
MMSDNRPIGIFDSGVGGLTVAKQVMAQLPNEQIIYFGDCLRVPYGEKSSEELAGFSRDIINFLLSKDAKAIIVACGTISSRIFDLVKTFAPNGIPIFGMLEPGVRAALDATRSGNIGIIATEGSINSRGFENAIVRANPNANVTGVACPLFPHLVEEGWFDNAVADMTAQIYMEDFGSKNIDTLLLGCTHYPLLSSSIAKALPAHVVLVDPAAQLVKELAQTISHAENRSSSHEYYVSGKKDRFDKVAKAILGHGISSILI